MFIKLFRLTNTEKSRAYRAKLRQPGYEDKLATYHERKREQYRRFREKQMLNNAEEFKRKIDLAWKRSRAKKVEEVVIRVMSILPKTKSEAKKVIQILSEKYL